MRISLCYLLVIIIVQHSTSWMIKIVPSIYPLVIESLENDITSDIHCAGFGVWSRYVPLSNIVQIGQIGILDSSCFHMFRIQDKINNEFHFLQYECVNFGQKTIKKYFQFLDSDGNIFQEEISMNEESYEYQWYFQGFVTIPSQKQIIIYIYENKKKVFQKQIQIEFPYEGINSNLIIGGDLKNSPFYTFENSLLTYFPGQMYYLLNTYLIDPNYFPNIIESNNNKLYCFCQKSAITNIGDVTIQKLDQFQFISQQTNCQQFLLSSWIKIKDMNSYYDEFDFQLFKLSGNFQNPLLTLDDLCAFQLFYKFSSLGNQIIIKSYSYTIPSVNIDFSNNPFLKTEIFDIDFDIQLWHFIIVEKTDTSISISITFYKGFDQKKFNTILQVKQFNMVQFKLLYGDILQSKTNYLKIQIKGLKLFNCPDKTEPQISCHRTCKECDGPTKEDCLSCFESSYRRYLPEFKECICEYGTIDKNDQCINYQALKFNLIQEKTIKEECQYGFFELNDDCYQCPSIINNNVITCLECIQNPKQWGKSLVCQTILYLDKNGSISKYLTEQKLQYILVGNNIQYCPDCNSIIPTYDYIDQVESIFKLKKLCQSILQRYFTILFHLFFQLKKQVKYYYNIIFLIKIFNQIIKQYRMIVFLVRMDVLNVNFQQQSFSPLPFGQDEDDCQPPNFVDFYEICIPCKIKHCLYCFNYLASDPTKTTLGFYQEYFLIDEEIKVGCAQCIEGFIFEFKTGQCIYQNPSQQNCLRSYIYLDDKEVCTLSAIDDFSIALEIINCQRHLLNCLRCIQTLQQTLKCLICEDGYLTSSNTGICIKCQIGYTKQCFEENSLEPWKWLIQGFIIQYLPDRPVFNGYLLSNQKYQQILIILIMLSFHYSQMNTFFKNLYYFNYCIHHFNRKFPIKINILEKKSLCIK